MFTGQNDLFLRLWVEPSIKNIQFNIHDKNQVLDGGYVPINKGGDFRRWYGNNDFVMRFDNGRLQEIT